MFATQIFRLQSPYDILKEDLKNSEDSVILHF